jgi:hypothetical protein
MKGFASLVLWVAMTGCHHQAPRADCDKHLVPINALAPAVNPATAAGDNP